MKTYEIKLAYDHTEKEEFVSWLNEQGHSAEIGNDSGTHIDGVWASTDQGANQVMNKLWSDYCRS